MNRRAEAETGKSISACTSWATSCSFLEDHVALQAAKWDREIEARNRPLFDEELDAMMPTEGYRILDPPPGYAPVRTPARKLTSTPTPFGTPGYMIPEENRGQQFDVPKEMEGLPEIKPEDQQFFGKLLKEVCMLLSCFLSTLPLNRLQFW